MSEFKDPKAITFGYFIENLQQQSARTYNCFAAHSKDFGIENYKKLMNLSLIEAFELMIEKSIGPPATIKQFGKQCYLAMERGVKEYGLHEMWEHICGKTKAHTKPSDTAHDVRMMQVKNGEKRFSADSPPAVHPSGEYENAWNNANNMRNEYEEDFKAQCKIEHDFEQKSYENNGKLKYQVNWFVRLIYVASAIGTVVAGFSYFG